MGAKDAVHLVENAGYNVVLKGTGFVKEQLFDIENNTVILKLS